MFVRVTKNSKGLRYLRIVRSYRKDGKVKQEVLFSLGRLDILQATGELDRLVESLSRFALRTSLVNLAKDLSIKRIYYLGAIHFVQKLWERMGLKKVFTKIEALHSSQTIPLAALTQTMVSSRFIIPSSKRRIHTEIWDKIYPDLFPVKKISLHWLYRTMDKIHDRRQEIERALFDRNGDRDLFNQELDLVFYDTTTLYFESADAKKGDLRRFGYSKEHKVDCTQVVLGLLVDRDGIPVGYELFPGNTYDGKTLGAILNKLKNRYQIKRIIFVADRGMLSGENIDLIKETGFEFIVGMRLWKLPKKEHETFYDLKKYVWMNRDRSLAMQDTRHAEDRLILTWSKDRSQRDQKVREDLLESIKTKLLKAVNTRRFVTNRGYREFLKGLEEGKPKLNEQAIESSKKKDGFFGVLTNIPKEKMSPEEIYRNYKNLWRIEDAFGEMKGPLKTRPMFHWTDKRIHAHVLICLLAYYIEATITKTLRDKKCSFSAPELFRSLNEVYAVPVKVRGVVAWVRNELEGIAFEGYRTLGIKPPQRMLKLEREGVVTQIPSQKTGTYLNAETYEK
jgi:transposase